MEENPQTNTRRLSEELGASKDTIHREIKTFGKSYRNCGSLPHELKTQQAQRGVDICRHLISNPMDDRFIRRIVTCDEKWVYYCSPDALKQWLGPHQRAKAIVKKSINVLCLVEFLKCDSLGVSSKQVCSRCGSLFSTTGTSS